MLDTKELNLLIKGFCFGALSLVFCQGIFAKEKHTPISERITGFPAHVVENQLSRRLQKKLLREGYEFVPGTLQCSAYLPLFSNRAPLLGGLLQMRHTWIEVDGRSYGMAYTLKHRYFGGEARIQSPDGFQKYHLWDVQCTPLMAPKSDRLFGKNLRKVLDRVSDAKDFLVLNYHVFQHNCLAAVDWAVECAGGKLSRVPNLGIGRNFGSRFKAYFRTEPAAEGRELKEICAEMQRGSYPF